LDNQIMKLKYEIINDELLSIATRLYQMMCSLMNVFFFLTRTCHLAKIAYQQA
jgi:hypothetical protein